MENEVGCYLILGAYTEKLRKRADLKNGEICKKVDRKSTRLNSSHNA